MGNVKVVLDMGALVELSNVANDKIAEPIAERVASAAGDGYEVRKTGRGGVPNWGRMRVFTVTPKAMVRERKRGALARALGSG